VAGPPEELDAALGGLDVGVVVEVLEDEHQVPLDDGVGPLEGTRAARGDGVDDAPTVIGIDASSDAPHLDERVGESGDALLRDGETERQIGLDRVTLLEVLQDPVLRERERGFVEGELGEAREPRDRVTERRLVDEDLGRPARAMMFLLATIAVVVVGMSAGLAAASAASPTVAGPVTGGAGAILPPNLNGFDLAQVGYEQSEYFLSGTADTYTPTAPLTSDGMWSVTPTTPAGYTTRAVVYRPIDPKKFNGTVIVEWLNVSGLVDANPDWTQTHNELIRDGFAWVGVSAQAAGASQLQCPTTLPTPPVAPCFVAPLTDRQVAAGRERVSRRKVCRWRARSSPGS
jgi:hypothetical protein